MFKKPFENSLRLRYKEISALLARLPSACHLSFCLLPLLNNQHGNKRGHKHTTGLTSHRVRRAPSHTLSHFSTYLTQRIYSNLRKERQNEITVCRQLDCCRESHRGKILRNSGFMHMDSFQNELKPLGCERGCG